VSDRRILIIEDGTEYIETMQRFVREGFAWERAGSGPAGLERLKSGGIDAILLDMRFDRAPEGELFGDLDQLAERFSGDRVLARRFAEDHQGTFILAALREAGHTLPVVLSYDFSAEPARFSRLAERFGPVAYLGDNASPDELRAALSG